MDDLFGRIGSIVFITCLILFSLFIVALLYKLCVLTAARMKFLIFGDPDRQPGHHRVSPSEQRVMSLLSRPGVRDVLTAKVRQTVAREQEAVRHTGQVTSSPNPLPPTPPPPYPDGDRISIASGPPPSYHSSMEQ